ncbi:MAG: hypothetical protein KJO50_01760, partial [Bacteroidia bacterium]|nr:hypothetical protein [Bacteroidia bacterium]
VWTCTLRNAHLSIILIFRKDNKQLGANAITFNTKLGHAFAYIAIFGFDREYLLKGNHALCKN